MDADPLVNFAGPGSQVSELYSICIQCVCVCVCVCVCAHTERSTMIHVAFLFCLLYDDWKLDKLIKVY